MPSDQDIEQFIGDSFSSIWDLELLKLVIEAGDSAMTSDALVTQMRGSQLVVEQGMRSLSAAGIATLEEPNGIRFAPVNAEVADCAREALTFYRRFPGRTRRLIVARQSPGLSAFANAFRLNKEDE